MKKNPNKKTSRTGHTDHQEKAGKESKEGRTTKSCGLLFTTAALACQLNLACLAPATVRVEGGGVLISAISVRTFPLCQHIYVWKSEPSTSFRAGCRAPCYRGANVAAFTTQNVPSVKGTGPGTTCAARRHQQQPRSDRR